MAKEKSDGHKLTKPKMMTAMAGRKFDIRSLIKFKVFSVYYNDRFK